MTATSSSTSRDYAVTSRPADLTRRMKRDAQKLPPGQIIREIMCMNPIEHKIDGADNIVVADVEKIAARHLRDADGKPVFRRIWVDNCSGIPYADMPHLLQNYGESSKPTAVFSGNHGEGAILSGAPVNPEGLVFLSNDNVHGTPYLCIFDLEDDQFGLVSFVTPEALPGYAKFVPIADAADVEYLNVNDTQFTYLDVWNEAYSNTKFPDGPPPHGTVVLELGEHPLDSTYMRTQRTFDGGRGRGTWEYSRWAIGEFGNSRFRSFPEDIKLYWGVPGPDFAFNFGRASRWAPEYGFKFTAASADVSFATAKNWHYREVKGLDATVMGTGTLTDADDPDASLLKGASIIVDSQTYTGGPVPFTAEVIIRELPGTGPVSARARKFAFTARRKGLVFVDYNGEVFARTEGNPHELFGISHADAKWSIWIAIKPLKVGVHEPGAVWMGSGRTELLYVDRFGASAALPWYDMAREFREEMPPALVAWIQAKDAAEPDSDLSEPELKRFFEKFTDETKTPPPLPSEPTMLEAATGVPDEETSFTTGRGPIVNPGVTHPKGPGDKHRKSPRKRIPLIKKVTTDGSGVPGLRPVGEGETPPPPEEAQPPLYQWVDGVDDGWPEEHERWAVIWEEPSSANDHRGKVKLNWQHWYVQEVYRKLTHSSKRKMAVQKAVRNVFMKSVVSKIAHRRTEATEVGVNDEELAQMFSPLSLTMCVLGWWDHDDHLTAGLKTITVAAASDPDDEPEPVHEPELVTT